LDPTEADADALGAAGADPASSMGMTCRMNSSGTSQRPLSATRTGAPSTTALPSTSTRDHPTVRVITWFFVRRYARSGVRSIVAPRRAARLAASM